MSQCSLLVQYHQNYIGTQKMVNMWTYENEFLKYHGNFLGLLRE